MSVAKKQYKRITTKSLVEMKAQGEKISMLTSYEEVKESNKHYTQFKAYKDKTVFSNTIAKGETGGLLYYELGPMRPDLVLKDLIHIFHPELLPDHELFFFKPLN